jgi:FemAB-related protein (PEP-CTERM system-associated)
MKSEIEAYNDVACDDLQIVHGVQNSEAWDAFVRSHPHGSTYHLTAWQRVIHETFGHEPRHIAAKDARSGKLVGVLPLFLVRSRIFGRMLISTPHAAYGGSLASSDAVAHAIFQRAHEMAKELNVEFLELRHFRNALPDDFLMQKDLYVTFRQELDVDPENCFLKIPRKKRYRIREGIKNGLEFKLDEITIEEFFELYSRNVRQLGTPVFPKRLFEHFRREFGADCKMFSVHGKDRLLAAACVLFYKDEFVSQYAASLKEYGYLSINNFMYWMLMKYGCENGYRTFDFGRSKKGTGACEFKEHWGMSRSDLQYQYALVRRQSMPDTSPLNPKFSLGIRAWQKLPLPVTQMLGPMISKHLV